MNYPTTRHRIAAHEANLKIVPGHESWVPEARTVLSESWRSGGGCVPHSTDRATLVRRVFDPYFEGFGGTSRYGQGIE